MMRLTALQDIAGDGTLRAEILDTITDHAGNIAARLATPDGHDPRRRTVDLLADVTADRARRVIDDPPTGPSADPADRATEAVVLRLGRPVLPVRGDAVDPDALTTDTWRARLAEAGGGLRAALPCVGRIALRHHPRLDWVGAGWLVADDVIVTNRHVADVFVRRESVGFAFRPAPPHTVRAHLDLRDVHRADYPAAAEIVEVLHVEDDAGPDIALLHIHWADGADGEERRAIPLAAGGPARHVAVVGYPARDSRVRMPAEVDHVFGNVYDDKHLAPGRFVGARDARGNVGHDATTLGGNAGSAVIDLDTGAALAVHVAGHGPGRTVAVPAAVVRDRLRRVRPAAQGRGRSIAPERDALFERSGYDPDFLGPRVDHPALEGGLADAVAPVAGTDDGILRYAHYSVRMHRVRRLAIYTAVNIDGRAARSVPRDDRWQLDPRLDPQFQVGNELYRHNDLDRGHLVRRLDPAWGNTFEDAQHAARDTFFYTNCAPQHRLHNQQLWLGLEDHILDSANVHGLRVSVFSGPVLRDDDRIYRDIGIPEDYWKIVAIVDSATDQLSVTGYVVSQRDYIDDIRFAFGPYETYQVPLATIEEQTGLAFGMTAFDPLAEVEGAAARRLTHPADIVL